MRYAEGTIAGYLDAVQGRSPTPGGGSVAALVGALAGALGKMVAVYTTGKKYSGVEPQVRRLAAEMEERIAALTRYVDEDCVAYDKVSAATGLPKDTDEEKESRREAMQEALRAAMSVPMEVCKECLRLLGSLRTLVAIGNKNLASDVGVAALLAAAAFEGARFNVEINLGSIRDARLVAETREEIDADHKEAIHLKNRIVAEATAAIASP